MKRVLGSIILGAALAVAGAAQAQVHPSAEALLREGIALRERSQDADALARFQHAYDLDHSGQALAQMALAEQALGRWVAAEGHLVQALASPGDRWVARNRRPLEDSLRAIRRHIGRFEVLTQTPGAELWIAGERAAMLPMREPVSVNAGDLTYELRAGGYVTETRHVAVAGEQFARETVNLTAVPPPPVVARGSASEPGSGAAASAPPTVINMVAPRTHLVDRGGTMRALGVGGLVAGGVLIVGGVIGMVLQASADQNYYDRCFAEEMIDFCTLSYETIPGTLGIAGLAIGSGLAVAGLVMFVAAPQPTREAVARTRFGCSVGPTGLSCSGTF